MIPDKRDQLFSALSELAEHLPDVRFGQLIANLATLARGPAVESVWDVEDEELLAAARRQLASFENEHSTAER